MIENMVDYVVSGDESSYPYETPYHPLIQGITNGQIKPDDDSTDNPSDLWRTVTQASNSTIEWVTFDSLVIDPTMNHQEPDEL